MKRSFKNNIFNLLRLNTIIILLLSIGIVSCNKENIIDENNNNEVTENDSVVTFKVNLFSESRTIQELPLSYYNAVALVYKKETGNWGIKYKLVNKIEIKEPTFELNLEKTDYKVYFMAISNNINYDWSKFELRQELKDETTLDFSDYNTEFKLLRSEVNITHHDPFGNSYYEMSGDIYNYDKGTKIIKPILFFMNGEVKVAIKNTVNIVEGYSFNDIKKVELNLTETSNGVYIKKESHTSLVTKDKYNVTYTDGVRNITNTTEFQDLNWQVNKEITVQCSCLPKYSIKAGFIFPNNKEVNGIGLTIKLYAEDGTVISSANINSKYPGLEIFPSTYSNLVLDGDDFYFEDYSINIDDNEWDGIHGPSNN